jgi:hypothetical protein
MMISAPVMKDVSWPQAVPADLRIRCWWKAKVAP